MHQDVQSFSSDNGEYFEDETRPCCKLQRKRRRTGREPEFLTGSVASQQRNWRTWRLNHFQFAKAKVTFRST